MRRRRRTHAHDGSRLCGALGPSVVKISRDGSREVIDQTMPPGQGRDKEFHSHLVYDFKAHTLYTQVVSDPGAPCGVQQYTDPGAPPEFDVISGSAALLKEIASPDDKSKQVGTETLNGIPTKVMEVTSSQANGKIWLAQDGGFPVKIVVSPPGSPSMTVIEIKQLSFSSRPPRPSPFRRAAQRFLRSSTRRRRLTSPQ